MLQWMGGSRKKITATRKGVHSRQQRFFEHRKHQQCTEVTEDKVKPKLTFELQKPVQSLDFLSLAKLRQAVHSTIDASNLVGRSPTKNQHSFSKGVALEHLEQIPNTAHQDAFMNDAVKGHWVFEKDSVIHGSEHECAGKGSLNPCRKDAATQWTPASALAAAECCLSKPTEKPKSSQVTRSHGLQGSLPSQAGVTILNILSDDENGGLLPDKQSPSELYAAFPLKGIGLLDTHTPEALVIQGSFDSITKRKKKHEDGYLHAHAKEVRSFPKEFRSGQRIWQSPMDESSDSQRHTRSSLDNMFPCKPSSDRYHFTQRGEDLVCDEESTSTQPFRDTPKQPEYLLSSTLTDKKLKWKKSSFKHCMLPKFDVLQSNHQKEEASVDFMQTQPFPTDGTFALGHINCKQEKSAGDTVKQGNVINGNLNTETFFSNKGSLEKKEDAISTLCLSDNIFETNPKRRFIDKARHTADFGICDIEVTSSPNFLNFQHSDDSPLSNSKVDIFATPPSMKLVERTESIKVTNQKTLDWNNLDKVLQVEPYLCEDALGSANSNPTCSWNIETQVLPAFTDRAIQKEALETCEDAAFNKALLLSADSEISFLSSIETYSRFPCLDELLSQENDSNDFQKMLNAVQGDPETRPVEIPKVLKRSQFPRLSPRSLRLVDKKPTFSSGVETNLVTAFKPLIRKMEEQKCSSDLKIRNVDARRDIEHEEPVMSFTRHSRGFENYLCGEGSSEYQTEITNASKRPGSKEKLANIERQVVGMSIFTIGNLADQSKENADSMKIRNGFMGANVHVPALRCSSPGSPGTKGKLCRREFPQERRSKKRSNMSDSFPCQQVKPTKVDQHQNDLPSISPEYVDMLESYVIQLKLINEVLRTTLV